MMEHYHGTLYKSRWDGSTWGALALAALCCLGPMVFDDDGWLPLAVCTLVFAGLVVILRSVYYRIDGDNLIVYQFFIPSAYPIGKITRISASKSWLSAPATSLTHRIAIEFADRKVLKSSMPLVISPVRQKEFIGQLLRVNPGIKVDMGKA